jgi:signal peptidase I
MVKMGEYNGNIYIDGEVLTEPIVTEAINMDGLAADEIVLDENEFFVLGDNRNNSEDSRFANVGNILSNEIVGKAWVRLNNFNFIDKLNLKKEEK